MPGLVSVVIPTFRRPQLTLEAAASALAQTGVAVELIIVDDGSADESAPHLDRRLQGQARVLVTEHAGVAAARNRGVAASRGEWIAFLDSDDLWLAGKLRAQLAYLAAHPELEICQTEEIWIRRGVRVNPCAHHRKPSGWIFEPSLRRCLVSPSAVLLRRRLFDAEGGFDEALPACEDYDLWLRIARRHPIGLVQEPWILKRGGHDDQLSRRYWGMDRFRVSALRKLLGFPDLTEAQRAAVHVVLREKCAILAQGARKRGRAAEAEHYLALARMAA